MPSRKRPRVVAPTGSIVEIWRRDMRGYERALIAYSPSKDSWHGLRCAGGAIRRFDLSQEFWHYAMSGKTRLGVLTNINNNTNTYIRDVYVDSSDEDEDFYDARRRIRPPSVTYNENEDAKSETHDNDMDDLGTLTLQLDINDSNGNHNSAKKSTVSAKLSVKQASPSTRATIVAGISAIRSIFSGMSLSFKKPSGSSKVG